MILAATLALTLCPQGSPGNMAGAAMTGFVDPQTAANNSIANASDGWLKPIGANDQPPDQHPAVSERPDFSPTAVPWAIPGLVVDAFSTNVNWVTVTQAGVATATTDGGTGWSAIVFSTTRATVGLSGTAVAQEAAAGDVAGDMFQYVLPDSQGVSSGLIGAAVRATDSYDIRLTHGSGASQIQPDITAFDLFVPILLGSPAVFGDLQLDFTGVLFSVDSTSVGLMPPGWWGSATPSAAVVFRTDWNPIGRTWSTPSPYLLPVQLGLTNADDVNALAWDSKHDRLLFSSDADSQDALMFLALTAQSPGPVPVVLPSGQPVSKATGLDPDNSPVRIDDYDAICAIDPRIATFCRSIGTPMPGPALLDATLMRGIDWGTEADEFVATLQPFAKLPSVPPIAAALWATSTPIGQPKETGLEPILLGVVPFEGTVPVTLRWPAPAALYKCYGDTMWQVVDQDGGVQDASTWIRICY